MPLPVPIQRSSGGRRRGPSPIRQRNENLHPPREAERIDQIASLTSDRIETVAENLTLADLLAFAETPTTKTPEIQPLTPGSFTPPTSSSPGSTDYVAAAIAAHPGNLARNDLGGLAVNAYQLGIDVGAAFGISPKDIGGRAYRPYKSDHTTGHARDIPGAGDRGLAIADWVIARAATYKVKYIIFNYRIWYPGKGWKAYNPSSAVVGFASDAGHVHHVHVSVY